MVKTDETLYSISFHYKQDYRDLARWNGIEPPYTLRPGQEIRVAPPRAPSHTERMIAARQPPSAVAPAGTAHTSVPRPAQPSPVPAPAETIATPERGAVTIPLVPQPAPARAPEVPAAPSARETVLAWHWPVRDMLTRPDTTVKPARKGLEIRAGRGEPVSAAADGRVVYGGTGIPHFGNLVIIKHNERFLSAYAHNQRLLVAEGEQVRAGQKIAEMGDSGTGTDGVKLHFEIRLDGTPVDPMEYLPARR